jgi:hypothetical protein
VPAVRLFLLLIALVLAGGTFGCREPEAIRKYTAERTESPRQHLIAAIFKKQPDKVWFFKLDGPEPEVKEHAAEFEKFIQTVRFDDKADPQVTWKAPAGWEKVEVKKEFRYATYRLPPKDKESKPVEMVVTPLGKEAGDLLANVNRWRQKIGLPPTTEAKLGQVTRQIKVAEENVTVVEMTGPGLKLVSTSAMLARGPIGEPPPKVELPTFKTPEGWEKAPPDQISLFAFQVGKGDTAVRVTISPMKVGQDVIENVNRWRGQVSLPAAKEAEIQASLRELKTDSGRAKYIDLVGPPTKKSPSMRILGAILAQDAVDWVFKMSGPADVVEQQKHAFEAFVGSFKFAGGER